MWTRGWFSGKGDNVKQGIETRDALSGELALWCDWSVPGRQWRGRQGLGLHDFILYVKAPETYSIGNVESVHEKIWKSTIESACSAGDLGSIPVWGRSPGEGNDKTLLYSCLENPMDRGAWRATVRGVARVSYDLATNPLEYDRGRVKSLDYPVSRMGDASELGFSIWCYGKPKQTF